MAFVEPVFTKGQVDQAGEILINENNFSESKKEWAANVLANWRVCHGYPMNTFQATLRNKIKLIDTNAIVAQRLKRAPSIIFKLKRFSGMKLSRMQDIGGLRAVLASVAMVRSLEADYRKTNFEHILVSSKDYITAPKDDGYRSVHLVYRYKNNKVPSFNGLSIELQIRSRIQHSWATAVETMGTFLGQALKSGQGDGQWRNFFKKAGAALARIEGTYWVPGCEEQSDYEVFAQLIEAENKLHVIEKLNGFAIAANKITSERGQGAYHLIVLDSVNHSVTIRPYPITRLEEAAFDYAAVEHRTNSGEAIEAVLVSAGPVEALRKAYPNYFLDTKEFVSIIKRIIKFLDSGKRFWLDYY